MFWAASISYNMLITQKEEQKQSQWEVEDTSDECENKENGSEGKTLSING